MSAATFWDTGPGGGRIILKRKPTRADLVMYARKAAPCTICRKGFSGFTSLLQHRRSHSGKRPFRCHQCKSSFIKLSHLKNHQLIKHNNRIKCKMCASVFKTKFMLVRHIVKYHGLDALTLPKIQRKRVIETKPEKQALKVLIKKSLLTVNEIPTKSKKKKKHKKHKKEKKKEKKSREKKGEKIETVKSDSKPRIIIKLPKNPNEQSVCKPPSPANTRLSSSDKNLSPPTTATSAPNNPGSKTENFTESVQTLSPKDSGIDDCSPIHETEHNETCASSTKSQDMNKGGTGKSAIAPSSSASVISSTHVSPVQTLPQLHTLVRNLQTEQPSLCSSKSDYLTRSSHISKVESNNSAKSAEECSMPHQDVHASPIQPPIKIKISKEPLGKDNYVSKLLPPPPSRTSSRLSSSKVSSESASAKLMDTEETSVTQSTSPRSNKRIRQSKAPKLCRLESFSSETVSSGYPTLSPPHSLKSEKDFGPLCVDVDEDPYAFDDDPTNNSPHLLPYTSTLPRRSDKYKLEPPVLERQIRPNNQANLSLKSNSKPKLTKQTDTKKRRTRKSPVRSGPSKEKSKTARERKSISSSKGKVLPDKASICDSITTIIESPASQSLNSSVTTLAVDTQNALSTPARNDHDGEVSLSDAGDIFMKHTTGKTSEETMPSLVESKVETFDQKMEMLSKVTTEPELSNQCSENTGEVKDTDKGIVQDKSLVPVKSQIDTPQSPLDIPQNKGEMEVLIPDVHPDISNIISTKVSNKAQSICQDSIMNCSSTSSTVESRNIIQPASPMMSMDVQKEPSHSHDNDKEEPADDINLSFSNVADLLPTDAQLNDISFNDSLLDMPSDEITTTDEFAAFTAFDSRPQIATHTSSEKRKTESEQIVVTLPGEGNDEAMTLVFDNDHDPFDTSDDEFDLGSSMSSTALPPLSSSLPVSHSSTPAHAHSLSNMVAAAAAVIDTDSEFADLQASYSPVSDPQVRPSFEHTPAPQVAPTSGYFSAFANFVGAKPDKHQSPGYSSEFAKFLSQKSGVSDESCTDSNDMKKKEWSRTEVLAQQKSFMDLEELCEKVCRLLRTLFPAMDIPTHRHSLRTVDMLMDQVMDIINDKDQDSFSTKSQSTCSNPNVLLCKEPLQSLHCLRRKVCEFLVTVLPEFVIPPSFNRTGSDVEKLLEFVIDCNAT